MTLLGVVPGSTISVHEGEQGVSLGLIGCSCSDRVGIGRVTNREDDSDRCCIGGARGPSDRDRIPVLHERRSGTPSTSIDGHLTTSDRGGDFYLVVESSNRDGVGGVEGGSGGVSHIGKGEGRGHSSHRLSLSVQYNSGKRSNTLDIRLSDDAREYLRPNAGGIAHCNVGVACRGVLEYRSRYSRTIDAVSVLVGSDLDQSIVEPIRHKCINLGRVLVGGGPNPNLRNSLTSVSGRRTEIHVTAVVTELKDFPPTGGENVRCFKLGESC